MSIRAQVSMEFLFLVGFVFFMAFGFIFVASVQMKDFSDSKKRTIILDFGDSLKEEMNIASVVFDGYQREISLPEKIDGTIDYSIIMSSSTLVISTEYDDYQGIIPKTTGNLQKGNNIVRKQNGTIFIENI